MKKWKSSIKQNTLTPIFNESFQFEVSGMHIADVAMEIVVMDNDKLSKDTTTGVVYMGEAVPHHTGRQHWRQILAHPHVHISNWHPILPVDSNM